MPTEIAFKIPVDTGQAEKSVGDLRTEFKQLNDVINSTKIGTKEYNDALLRLGKVKGDLTDLKKGIIALDPDRKIQAFATAGASIAGGFAAAQGAIALFGGESKLVTATMVKLQAVMALTQGIQAVGQLAKAWKVLNLTMMANPYMAIAAALIALGATFVGVTKHLGFMKTDAQKAQEAIDKLTDAYERLGKEGEFQLKLLRAKGKETFEAEEKLLLKRIAIINQQVHIAEESTMGFFQFLNTIWFGAEATESEALKKAKELQKQAFQELEILRTTQTTKIKEREEDEAKKKDEKDAKKQEETEEKQLKFLEKITAEDERATEDKERKITESLERITKENERSVEYKRYLEQGRRELEFQQLIEDEENRRKIKEQGLANERAILQARMSIATSSIQGLSSLGNLFINNEKKAAAFQKGVALADLAVNTGQAITSMLVGVEKTAAAAGPAYPFVKASLYIAGFATILGNMAKAKAIIKGANQGSSPSLESPVLPPPPSAPSLLAPAAQTTAQATAGAISGTGTQTTEEGYFSGFQQPIKAYVVETEITNSQKNIQGILQKSTFP